MKKNVSMLIGIAVFFSSLHMSATEGFKLNTEHHQKRSLLQRPAGDSDEGVKDKIMITAGAGLNLLGTTMELRYLANGYYAFEDHVSGHNALPLLNLAVDYGFHEKFSAGVAFGYQKVTMNLHDIITVGDVQHDTWTRLHFAARADYYIVSNDNLNLYTGVKLGYNLYTVTTTIPQQYYPDYTHHLWFPATTCEQAHFGMSYYFSDMVGVNAEIGLGFGSPYLLEAGLAIRL
jgi:hypothetical protein